MKFQIKVFTLLIIGASSLMAAQAQTNITEKPKKELDSLLATKTKADTILVNLKIKQLASSKYEPEMYLAATYLYRLKNASASDSLLKQEALRFPLGTQKRSEEQQGIYNLKGADVMEAAYQKWIVKFPPENFPVQKNSEDRLIYDYVRSAIASAYAKEKQTGKAVIFADKLEVDFWKGNGYGSLSDIFYGNEDLINAETYARKAMESAESYLDGRRGNGNAEKFAAFGYPGYCAAYAKILYDEKKYNEALKYIDLPYIT